MPLLTAASTLRIWPRHCAGNPLVSKELTMKTPSTITTNRYAKVIEVSQRVRWDIERDVIRGRTFDFMKTFLPPGLTLVRDLDFLDAGEQRLYSQVQGRTYAYIFGLVERFIVAKVIELSGTHALGDQRALEALVRMADEEIKHQELFARLERMLASTMPTGYTMTADPDAVAQAVLGKSRWAVLALTLFIELFTQAHYRASIEPQDGLCPLWKDVFLFHWREESQHAILDELEFERENARRTAAERDAAINDLIGLVGAIDGILQAQAKADTSYFCTNAGEGFSDEQRARIDAGMLKAYRWQYIVSGAMEPRFRKTLFGCLEEAQVKRIEDALAPLSYAVPQRPEMTLPMAA
jgi:hypothetical protein